MIYSYKLLKNLIIQISNKDDSIPKSSILSLKENLSLEKYHQYLAKNGKPLLYSGSTILADFDDFSTFLDKQSIPYKTSLMMKIDNNNEFSEYNEFFGNIKDIPLSRNKVKKNVNKKITKKEDIKKNIDKLFDSSFIILDIENHEKNQNTILEVGLLFYSNKKHIIKHYIVEENLEIRNGKYVPDNKLNFDFGESVIADTQTIISEISKYCQLTKNFVGHEIGTDIKFLKNHGTNFSQVNIFDTSNYSKIMNEKGEKMSIKRILESNNELFNNLHNAGNDCYYNMVALRIIKNKILKRKKNTLLKK